MLIGETAERAGVTRDTVRLYTRLGLIACTTRTAGSRQYAEYDDQTAELIKNIKIAQSIGFSLTELAPIAHAYVSGNLDEHQQRILLERKLDEIEEKRRQLGQMARFLRSKLNELPAP